MKTNLSGIESDGASPSPEASKSRRSKSAKPKAEKRREPFEVFKQGSISIPIYAHTNVIPERDPGTGKIIYDALPDGTRKARVKYQSTMYTLAYYEGSQRVRRKFSDLDKAKQEAELVAIRLANGETEALKLTGADRGDYTRSMQCLRGWRPDADLYGAIKDYVANVRRLPENVTLKEVLDSYLKRHPTGLPAKTVRQVVDELIEAKRKAGKSAEYLRELDRRLGKFAACLVPVQERANTRRPSSSTSASRTACLPKCSAPASSTSVAWGGTCSEQ